MGVKNVFWSVLGISLLNILCIILFLPIVYGATISGTVYDASLNKINNVKVIINTLPKQTLIAKNGTYTFQVPNGNYTLKAEYYIGNSIESLAEENILVKDEGNYVVDLILFPSFNEEDELLNETLALDVGTGLMEEEGFRVWYITGVGFGVLAVIAIGGFWYYFKYLKKGKKSAKTEEIIKEAEKKEEKTDDLVLKVLEVIKKEGGRTTQKDIRKQIPFSEAKISLIIAELEHKGLIEKIKKGRGNIIILKGK